MIQKEHVEPIHSQMQCEEEGKISLKDIADLTNMPKYKAQTSISKHFRDFETYLSQHYGGEGFPLDYVVHPKLAVPAWVDTMNPCTTSRVQYQAFQA